MTSISPMSGAAPTPPRTHDEAASTTGLLLGSVTGLGLSIGTSAMARRIIPALGPAGRWADYAGLVQLGLGLTGIVGGGIAGTLLTEHATRFGPAELDRDRAAHQADTAIERRTYAALANGSITDTDRTRIDEARRERMRLAAGLRRDDARHGVLTFAGGAVGAGAVLGAFAIHFARTGPSGLLDVLGAAIALPVVTAAAGGLGALAGAVASRTLLRGDERQQLTPEATTRIAAIDAEIDAVLAGGAEAHSA